MDHDDILIMGAGPAGLACAMELYKEGLSFTVVEKDKQAGGLSQTYKLGEFRTDNGPHRFYSQNQYLYDFIEDLLGEKWITVDRFTKFCVEGKFYHYPVEWRDTLANMGIMTAMRALTDYLTEQIRPRRQEPENFEAFAIANFGKTLANFNMLNYTEKIWGMPCSQISVDWAKQRIKGLTLKSLVTKALLKKAGPRTLTDQFYYPEMGSGQIYQTIAEKISRKNHLLLENEPVRIVSKDNLITEVNLRDGKSHFPKTVVSSIPITTLIGLMDPAPSSEIMDAVNGLRFRSQVYLFVTIDKPSVSKNQWIYFPDAEIPFGRISEMVNFSSRMAPEGKTSLFIEFFCWKDDNIWNASKDDLFELSIPWLEKLELITRDEVMDAYHFKRDHVYPVYDLAYKGHLDVIKHYLNHISNLIYIGRPGRFLYTNQDHSLEMGILAARSIIDNKRYNIEDIGVEQAYFERGFVKTRQPVQNPDGHN